MFLGGGPGSFVLEDFGPRVSGSLARDLTAGRDFVMFDQRGVGFSEPALNCPELGDLGTGLSKVIPLAPRRLTTKSKRRSLAEIAFWEAASSWLPTTPRQAPPM